MDRYRVVLILAVLWWANTGLCEKARGSSARDACITRLGNRVQLVNPRGAARAARLGERLGNDAVIRTGKSSHAELTFADQTVFRLAANTILSFASGGRDLNLIEGAVLVECPKSAIGAKVRTGEIAAAIGGTTGMLEHHPGVCKFLVLQGTGRLYRPQHPGDSVLVGPGQMVIGNPKEPVSDPVDFDIERFVATSRLIVDLPRLPEERLIATEAHRQRREKSGKTLIETNMVIYGGGTTVSLVNSAGPSLAPVKKHEKK